MPTPPPPENTRFKPGQSGNRRGRPKGTSVSDRLRKVLQAGKIGDTKLPRGKKVADLLTELILKKALKGDAKFLHILLDRSEGKAPETVEHSGKLTVEVVYEQPGPSLSAETSPATMADTEEQDPL
jgi:hypothetical protein